jgi:magnesium-transporting ATPase (P-type)
MTVMALLTGD